MCPPQLIFILIYKMGHRSTRSFFVTLRPQLSTIFLILSSLEVFFAAILPAHYHVIIGSRKSDPFSKEIKLVQK